MNRSKVLFKLQQMDTKLDEAQKRIKEIKVALADTKELDDAVKEKQHLQKILDEKNKLLKTAENNVEDQNLKLAQNQKKLYGGAITNPKELEDLQQEADSLTKYLKVLEERQLEAMIDVDQAQSNFDQAADLVEEITDQKQDQDRQLTSEHTKLEESITSTQSQKDSFLDTNPTPDLDLYHKLRASSGGIAVSLMTKSSCSACGANIPSAIEQAARSPGNLSFCPACKRILHSDSI